MRLLSLIAALLVPKAPPATPSPAPAAPAPADPGLALGSRVLRVGALQGPDVAWVQRAVGVVPEDGWFGPLTAAAVAAFQRENGLLADGVVGPATWRALGVGSPSAAPVFSPEKAPGSPLTGTITRALRATNAFDPEGWGAVLAPEMERGDITTARRIAPFLANAHAETGGLRRLVEDLYYTPERMMQVWPGRFPTRESALPYARNPRALGNHVYGGRLGNFEPEDGYNMRGRGCFQTTGRHNYQQLAISTRSRIADLTSDASPLLARDGAVRSAVVFWGAIGGNDMADAGDSRLIRTRINGSTRILDEVLELEAKIRAALL